MKCDASAFQKWGIKRILFIVAIILHCFSLFYLSRQSGWRCEEAAIQGRKKEKSEFPLLGRRGGFCFWSHVWSVL